MTKNNEVKPEHPAENKPLAAAVKAEAVEAKPAAAMVAAASEKKPLVRAARVARKAAPAVAEKAPAKAVKLSVKPVVKPVAKPAPAKAAPKAAAAPAPAKKQPVAKPAVEAREKAKKAKLVRDSFTMPETEYSVLGQVKKNCLKAGIEVKKSELLRAGVALIEGLDIDQLKMVLASLTPLKAGRPKKLK